MSDTSSLTQLAKFVGQSSLSSATPQEAKHAAAAIRSRLAPGVRGRGVADLLGIVLTLSARTRRMALPPVAIDLDVFAPSGGRAVRVFMPSRN